MGFASDWKMHQAPPGFNPLMHASNVWQPCWKLTNDSSQSYNGCAWGKNVENPHGVLSGRGGLCSSGFYHAYDNAYLAVLLNPIHANFHAPVLWQAEWRGTREDDNGLKFGATELRTVGIVKAPTLTTEQQVAFAIFCAASVFDEATRPEWHEWATRWLQGENRTDESAAWSAESAAWSAAWSAESAGWSAGCALESSIAWALALVPGGK